MKSRAAPAATGREASAHLHGSGKTFRPTTNTRCDDDDDATPRPFANERAGRLCNFNCILTTVQLAAVLIRSFDSYPIKTLPRLMRRPGDFSEHGASAFLLSSRTRNLRQRDRKDGSIVIPRHLRNLSDELTLRFSTLFRVENFFLSFFFELQCFPVLHIKC